MQNHLSFEYLAPKTKDLLQAHQLFTFNQLWNYQGEWFEAPNRKQDGWSGVSYLSLMDSNGQEHGFYLKRQENYMRKTWRHPFKGEPTFKREFEIIQYLSTQSVLTPTISYFAFHDQQCIFVTEALKGFISADDWFRKYGSAQDKLKMKMIEALAKAVNALHRAGVQHRSLYLKHLFVRVEHDANVEVAIIDFESSRITKLIGFYQYIDLIKLMKRAKTMALLDKGHLLDHYFAGDAKQGWRKYLKHYIQNATK